MLTNFQLKLLKLIIKNPGIRLNEVLKLKGFQQSKVVENVSFLEKLNLVEINKTKISYVATVEGKSFIKICIKEWFYQNLLAIIAIIISLIALFK